MLIEEKLMPEPYSYHRPNSTVRFYIGSDYPGQAVPQQYHTAGTLVSAIAGLVGRL